MSIVMRDEKAGELGVAVCTGMPGVGMVCPFVEGGVAAVATQANANPYLATIALKAVASGASAGEALERALASDPYLEQGERQLHLVTASGDSAAYTGDQCVRFAADDPQRDMSVAGNMLTGPDVLADMRAAAGQHAGEALSARLLAAIEAGVDAGGDMRGHRSAALIVCRRGAVPVWRVHVEDDPDPVGRLRTLVEATRVTHDFLSEYVDGELAAALGDS